MKTENEWIEEWGDLNERLPPYSRRDDPEVYERAMKICERIKAIKDYLFGGREPPPEEWEFPEPPTPEIAAQERAEREAELLELARRGIVG
ncbi:MAG: hypothetical protein ACOX5G_08740 [Kiritimatiellia bacterium]|jgi:hypothetical protein